MVQVITEVNIKYGSDGCAALTCLPPAIWAQLSLHIQPLLIYQTGVDHSLVLRWCHRRLREVAETRYLTHSTAQVLHTIVQWSSWPGSTSARNYKELYIGNCTDYICYYTRYMECWLTTLAAQVQKQRGVLVLMKREVNTVLFLLQWALK